MDGASKAWRHVWWVFINSKSFRSDSFLQALPATAEELQKQLAETEKQITSASTTAAGLEKLMGYYANDPVAQKKAQEELEALKQKAKDLRERKRLILEKLKAGSDAPPSAPAASSSTSTASTGAGDNKKEILEEELTKIKEMLRKQSTAAAGLEKLIGFYASDPQQQQKTMAELKDMKGKIEELKVRQKQIAAELKEIKDKAATTQGNVPGTSPFLFALETIVV